jgi:hypothetical protein
MVVRVSRLKKQNAQHGRLARLPSRAAKLRNYHHGRNSPMRRQAFQCVGDWILAVRRDVRGTMQRQRRLPSGGRCLCDQEPPRLSRLRPREEFFGLTAELSKAPFDHLTAAQWPIAASINSVLCSVAHSRSVIPGRLNKSFMSSRTFPM